MPDIRTFLALLAATTLPAFASELQLRNGDTLTGELIRQEHGRIVFKSPVLGELNLSETDAKVIPPRDSTPDTLAGLPPSAPPPAPPTAKPAASTAPAAKPWRTKLEFGYLQQSGRRDTLSLTFRLDTEGSHGPHTFKATGKTLYGQQNHQTNSERYDATLRWRYQLTPRLFTQTLSTYATDKVKNIDYTYEQNAGLGYRLIQHPRHTLNAGLGTTGQYRRVDNLTEDPVLLGEFFQDYTWKIAPRLTFLQEANALYSDKRSNRANVSASNYRLRLKSTLQGRVTERLSLNLRYEYDYDNTLSATTGQTDQRITTTLGYAL